MALILRFHLDESATPAIAIGLRRRGRDCTTTQEEGLRGASDLEQLAHCKEQGRVIITADSDFSRLVSHDHNHHGVIFWTTDQHFGKVVNEIDEMCMTMTAENFRGRIFYL